MFAYYALELFGTKSVSFWFRVDYGNNLYSTILYIQSMYDNHFTYVQLIWYFGTKPVSFCFKKWNRKSSVLLDKSEVKNFMQSKFSIQKRFCDHYGGRPFFGWIWGLEIIFGHFFLSIFQNLKIECQKMPYQHKCPTRPSERTYQTINGNTDNKIYIKSDLCSGNSNFGQPGEEAEERRESKLKGYVKIQIIYHTNNGKTIAA